MLRIATVLLVTILAVLTVVSAIRTGRVQVAFSTSNTRCRKQDTLAFWFFTMSWSVLALVGLVGCSLILTASMFGVGPDVPAWFWTVTWKQWPMGVLSACAIYLIIQRARDITNRPSVR